MRRLYDIDEDILSCVDEETGEVDEERLNALNAEREKKVEGVALWVLELDADIKAYKEEEERFKSKRKAAEKVRESLKRYLLYATDGEKFHSTKVDVSFTKSKGLVIEDEYHIPLKYYKTTIDKRINKELLRRDLVNKVVEVEGCFIEERLNTQVK